MAGFLPLIAASCPRLLACSAWVQEQGGPFNIMRTFIENGMLEGSVYSPGEVAELGSAAGTISPAWPLCAAGGVQRVQVPGSPRHPG